MSLINEIQEATVDSSIDLPTLLRKCRLLAARMRNQGLAQWADYELNRSPSIESLPSYRTLGAQSFGDFYDSLGNGMKNAPIPSYSVPSEVREFITSHSFLAGVGEIDAMVQNFKNSSTIQLRWSSDVFLRLGETIYSGYSCFGAWKMVSRSAVIGILETVRNRILEFSIEIEAELLDDADLSSLAEFPQERSQQIFQTVIYGDVGNLSYASSGFSQTAEIQVAKNNLSSLKDYLEKHKVTEEDICELFTALEEDDEPDQQGKLGERTSVWIGKMVGKAVSGAWNVSSSAAADLLKQAILSYYDLI
ncbi:MAG: hypothetical protein F4X83_01985 [Chloroflexi bacterium]|nr:hypothetical protein [Chloroflexota bacterium]